MNGINLAVEKPDLLDRCLLIGLERISQFKEETNFWGRFQEAKPRILGAIFDVLVKTLALVDTMPAIHNVRLADFMRLGCAITEALGQNSQDFLDAYEHNVHRQNEEALEASPVAVAILDLLERESLWQGTPTELLTKFNERAALLKINTKSGSWPKDSRWLWRRMQEAKTNLEANHIKIERSRDRKRIITIQKIVKNDGSDGGVDENIKNQSLSSTSPGSTLATDNQNDDGKGKQVNRELFKVL